MINHNQYMTKSSNVFTPTSNIIYVQGETGAKAYPILNGYNAMLLMDAEDTKFYIKSVDNAGIPSMKSFHFEEIIEPEPQKIEYVTKDDFKQFENKILKLLKPKEEKSEKTKGGEEYG